MQSLHLCDVLMCSVPGGNTVIQPSFAELWQDSGQLASDQLDDGVDGGISRKGEALEDDLLEQLVQTQLLKLCCITVFMSN